MINSDAGTILVVDDDASIRRSLRRVLRASGFSVEVFDCASKLLARGRPAGPTCTILDLALPGMNGLEIQARLHEVGCGMSIVFLTGHGDVQSGVSAMKGGAVDFLIKPVQPVKLLAAVRRALAADVARTSARNRISTIRNRVQLLTDRERAVFELVVTGLLNKQIAANLGIAVKTVKVHRARVMEKMSVHSIAELARMAETLDLGVPS
jgi:FixJ family two-component response regulator